MFVEFFAENIIWFAALFLVLAMLVITSLQHNIRGVSYISHLQLPQLQREASAIIDVSEESEYKSGHIAGAFNLPVKTLSEKNNLSAKYGSKNVILVCQTGNHSVNAAKYLKSQGVEKLFILKGGMLTWKKENLPIEI